MWRCVRGAPRGKPTSPGLRPAWCGQEGRGAIQADALRAPIAGPRCALMVGCRARAAWEGVATPTCPACSSLAQCRKSKRGARAGERIATNQSIRGGSCRASLPWIRPKACPPIAGCVVIGVAWSRGPCPTLAIWGYHARRVLFCDGVCIIEKSPATGGGHRLSIKPCSRSGYRRAGKTQRRAVPCGPFAQAVTRSSSTGQRDRDSPRGREQQVALAGYDREVLADRRGNAVSVPEHAAPRSVRSCGRGAGLRSPRRDRARRATGSSSARTAAAGARAG